jgi:hypothetical protein
MYRFSLPARVGWAAFALAASATPAGAQNLLSNGDFAARQQLSGWEFSDAMPTWTAFDIDGLASSGSAYFLNDSADPGTQLVVLRQCIPITEAGVYIVST